MLKPSAEVVTVTPESDPAGRHGNLGQGTYQCWDASVVDRFELLGPTSGGLETNAEIRFRVQMK